MFPQNIQVLIIYVNIDKEISCKLELYSLKDEFESITKKFQMYYLQPCSVKLL